MQPGGDDARLAHGAARHLLPAPRLLDQLLRSRQHRAHRGAQPLGEVDPGGVEAARPSRRPAPRWRPRRSSGARRRDACAGRARGPSRAPRASSRAATPARRRCWWSARPTPAASAACSGSPGACAASSWSPVNTPPSPSIGLSIAPASAAGPPASAMIGWARRSHRISSPAARMCSRNAISLHIVPGGQEQRRLVAEQLRHPLLQRVHGRVQLALLVAPPRPPRWPPASPRSGGSACRCRG